MKELGTTIAAGVLLAFAMPLQAAEWSSTIERTAPSIVSIQVDSVRAFDTEWNASAQGTGFIVDAERGIILTNRHIVQSGPVTAQAVFRNHEVVDLKPIYRDPVHDFGFFQYDPDDLKFIEPQSIRLRPDRATVGREIRVIGNDAGEQLSILAGTLARLDREAPNYGRGYYNDFNTFYIQAASGTSGGSSGSPVIDIDGNAVALNAGGRADAASSYYLPLDRVARALRIIQSGGEPSRGTLQTTFVHKPFDELRRLGLAEGTEARVRTRSPDETGMLVVEQVLPGGAADGLLQPGDILVELGAALTTRFPSLEAGLDEAVGEQLRLRVERGGKSVELELTVTDLHAITPARLIEFGGAVVNRLSYQQARGLYREQRGVYVANPGYVLNRAGIPRGAVITAVQGEPVEDLDAFRKLLLQTGQDERLRLRYYDFQEPRRDVVSVMTMDWRWHPAQDCRRNDRRGLWDCEPLAPGSSAGSVDQEVRSLRFPDYGDATMNRIARSTVFIEFDMPYLINGVGTPNYFGTGLVVDAERGLVLADRNTVPVSMGDVRLTFGGSVELEGHVIYVHPLHNLAIIQYDPVLLGDTRVRSAELAVRPAQPGEEVSVIGFRPNQALRMKGSRVQDISPLQLPLSSSFQFREANMSVVRLETPPDGDGVLLDEDGKVLGVWSSFSYQSGRGISQTFAGIPSIYIQDLLPLARAGRDTELRSLEVELYFMPLASARKLGLPQAWAERIEAASERERRVLAVDRTVAGSPAEQLLEQGDLVLAVEGQVATDFRVVEEASQKQSVELTILRDGKVLTAVISTVALSGRDTDRLLVWAGAQLHEPHRAVAVQRGIPREGLLVAFYNFGSPASHYGLGPGRRIVAVDDQPVSGIDDFLDVVSDKQQGDAVRLKTALWDGRIEIITLELDLHYWPTYEVRRNNGNWQRLLVRD
ncbi:MAG: trypsin-like peptidase domain-containing protein [Gammaproteobacteria bacterium]|nr:trypsin-like peptidase domain-containing protein [Gammaproteobacteria bacterium]